jgi:hypothetical protein
MNTKIDENKIEEEEYIKTSNLLNDNESVMFQPYKSSGLVTTNVPLSVTFNDNFESSLIYSSIGNSFHCYTVKKKKF